MKGYELFLSQMQEQGVNASLDFLMTSPMRAFFKYWKKEMLEKDSLYVEKYQHIVEKEEVETSNESRRTFLSVIIRTQGKREEMLRETLLTLYGQTDDDFEVILVKYKATPENSAIVDAVVVEQPPSLRCRIRTIELNEGNRTASINTGIAYSHGDYFAVLDDDDMVFDHWVESFHKAAEKESFSILHSYVVGQKWEILQGNHGNQTLRAVETFDSKYCRDFDYITQARVSFCPPMSIAFPACLFRKYGKIFDETLDTMEDWDYIMRFAYLFGVVDINTPTAVYRNFVNDNNSNDMNKEHVWHRNYVEIVDKGRFNPGMIMIKPEQWHQYLVSENGLTRPADLSKGEPPQFDDASLYVDYGEGYKEIERRHNSVLNTGSLFESEFNFGDEKRRIRKIRYDVTEYGLFGIKDFYFSVEYVDGNVFFGSQKDISYTNGCQYDHNGSLGIWFEDTDPQIEIIINSAKMVKSLHFYGRRTNYLPAKELLERKELGCICSRYIKTYEDVYRNYFLRLSYFRYMLQVFKEQEAKERTNSSKNVDEIQKAIEEYQRDYDAYRSFIEKAIDKDLEWGKKHSKKAIVRLYKLKFTLKKKLPR